MVGGENQAQSDWRSAETGTGGRVIAAVAHCTAVATSLPLDSAWKAPCAAARHAPAGAPPRLAQANHSAYERSSGVGTTFLGSTFRLCSTTSHEDLPAVPVGVCAGGGGGGAEGGFDAGGAGGGWAAAGGCCGRGCGPGCGCATS